MKNRRASLAIALLCGVLLGALGARFAFREPPPPPREPIAKKPTTRREKTIVVHDAIVRDVLRADVVLPATDDLPTPIVVIVHERGWPPPDERDRTHLGIVDVLARRGIAVVSLAFAVREGSTLDETTTQIAGAVREIGVAAKDWATIPEPVLMGDEVGATVVASLALDPKYGLDPTKLRAVIGMNGIYDGPDLAPAKHARKEAPPFLLLSAHDESRRSPPSTRAFARALERAGAAVVRRHHLATREMRSLTNLSGERNDVGDLVTSFARREPTPGGPESPFAIEDTWDAVKAPFTSEGFAKDPALVVKKPTTTALKAQLLRIYGETMRDLEPWPGETYDAIDLDRWLVAHPELGAGPFVVVKNVRGEELVLRREEIAKKKPEIVVGIDDEKNLYRMFLTYSVMRTYSWKPETAPRPTLARPVGAFLHWPSDANVAGVRVATLADFALVPESFAGKDADPLSPLRGIANPLGATLLDSQGCVQCHAYKGVGARGHHLRAADGKPTGGFGLPLEEYPRDVLRRFLFEQEAVAKSFGVNPLIVDARAAQALYASLSP